MERWHKARFVLKCEVEPTSVGGAEGKHRTGRRKGKAEDVVGGRKAKHLSRAVEALVVLLYRPLELKTCPDPLISPCIISDLIQP